LQLLFDQLDWSCSLISWDLTLLERWSSQTSEQPAATMLPPPIQAHCFFCCRCFLQGLFGSLLFDSPGLGKTIQAICLMLANPRNPGVCLVSKHTIWVSVQARHAESLNPTHQPEY
jgi:SNF2 family DNA or RNA helicase